MTSDVVAIGVDATGLLHAFDGARHVRGAVAVDVANAAACVALFDAHEVIPRLPSALALDPDVVVDVAALARFYGLGGDPSTVYVVARARAVGDGPCSRSWLEALRNASEAASVLEAERLAMRRTHRINVHGVGVDRARALELARLYADRREESRAILVAKWPSVDLARLRSETAFRAGLEAQFLEAVTSTAIGSQDGVVGEIVDARQLFIQFDDAARRMREVADAGDRLTHFFRYAGAATGRYSCRGRLNLHGLPKRPQPGLRDLVRQRDVIVPPPGQWFAARDLHAVEARVLAYLSGETKLIERFRQNEDVYSWFAGLVWPDVVIDKGGEYGHLRDIGKVAVLSLGFGVGFETFEASVRNVVPSVQPRELEVAYRRFRREFPAVMQELRGVDDAVHSAIRRPGRPTGVCGSQLSLLGDTLKIELPSGRSLFYRGLVLGESPGGDEGLWFPSSWSSPRRSTLPTERIGRDDASRMFADGHVRQPLRAYVLVNNIVQAVARDVCVHLENELERRGVPVAFSVHDSVVGSCQAEPEVWIATHSLMESVMQEVPRTLPESLWELPLRSDPETNVMDRFG